MVGAKCDTCAPDHYGIDKGSGCEPCDCNAYGVAYKSTLNEDRTRERELDQNIVYDLELKRFIFYPSGYILHTCWVYNLICSCLLY